MESVRGSVESLSARTPCQSKSIEEIPCAIDHNQHKAAEAAGSWGWVIVGTTFAYNIIQGINLSGFSVFYVEWLDYFESNRGSAGWIGSAFIATGNTLCVPISIVIEKFGTRKVAIAGAFCTSLGFLACSFAPNIEVLTITYGCLGGLGNTLSGLSAMIAIQYYFDRNRAIATGIAFTGMSVGNLICGPFIQVLIDTYGWRGAMMLISAISLNGLVMAATLYPLQQPQSRGKEEFGETKRRCCCSLPICYDFIKRLCDCSFFNKIFLMNLVGTVFLMLGYAPFGSHTPSRAVSYGIDKHLAAWLPTCIGGSLMVSRFLFAFVANLKCVNRILQYGIAITVAGILTMLYTFAKTFEGIIAFSIIIGSAYGCFLPAQTPMLVDLVGVSKFGRVQSIYNMAYGIGSLISVPSVGYLVDVTHNYDLPFYVTGCLLIIGGLIISSSFFLKAQFIQHL